MSDNIFDVQATCIFGEYLHVDTGREFCTMVGARSGGVYVQVASPAYDDGDEVRKEQLIPSMAFLCAIFGPIGKYPNKVGIFLTIEVKQPDGSYVALHKTEPTCVDEKTLEISRTNKDYPDCDYFSFHIRGMFGPIPLSALTRVTAYAIIDSEIRKCGETYFIYKAEV